MRCKNYSVSLIVDSKPRLLTYVPLFKEFKRRGADVIFVLSDNASDVSMLEYHINESDCERLASIDNYCAKTDIVVAPETVLLDSRSKAYAVALCHSLPDDFTSEPNYRGLLKNRPNIASSFDALIVPTPLNKKAMRPSYFQSAVSGIFPREMLINRTASLKVFSGGYPKIDYLTELTCGLSSDPSVIIYSPTSSRLPYSRLFKDGEAIIQSLLKFSDVYKIVFRPYPNDRRAIQWFNELGFEGVDIDLSVSGENLISKASLVVTDRSSFAITFSLSSMKPSILVDWESELGLTISPIGYYSENPSDFSKIIQNALNEDCASRIADFGKNFISNYKTSSKCIVDFIASSYFEDETASVSVPRQPYSSVSSSADEVHLTEMEKIWSNRTRWQTECLRKIKQVLETDRA